MSAILLECIEGLGHSPFANSPGETWERLQAAKEEVSRELLAEGTLAASDLLQSATADEYAREISWRRRVQLEERLRDLNEAQDRLMDCTYGHCTNCEAEVDSKRLLADPAAARCIDCRRSVETAHTLPLLSLALEIGSIP